MIIDWLIDSFIIHYSFIHYCFTHLSIRSLIDWFIHSLVHSPNRPGLEPSGFEPRATSKQNKPSGPERTREVNHGMSRHAKLLNLVLLNSTKTDGCTSIGQGTPNIYQDQIQRNRHRCLTVIDCRLSSWCLMPAECLAKVTSLLAAHLAGNIFCLAASVGISVC